MSAEAVLTADAIRNPEQEPDSQQFNPFIRQNHTPRDYGSAANYADAVRAWYMSSYNWLQCQHRHFLQNNPVSSSVAAIQVQPPNNTINNQVVNIRRRQVLIDRNAVTDFQPEFFQRQEQIQNQRRLRGLWFWRMLGWPTVSYQNSITIIQRYSIPPFSRRVIAEIIDFFILFLIKMTIVYLLVEIEAIDLDQLETILNNNADMQTLIDLTQGLFYLEVISKIFSGILEALCITYGFANYPPGRTPGKLVMGLQIISCLDIHPVAGAPNRVTITRESYVCLKDSLIRSLLKNSVTNFLFPINIFFYTFNYNRAVYDLAAKTIVVST